MVDTVAHRIARIGDGKIIKRKVFTRVVPLLEAIVRFGSDQGAGRLTAGTTHRLIEFLNEALDVDPVRVIRYASEIAKAGSKDGYQYDSMAISEVVSLVERVLANHRTAVSGGEGLTHLLELLDLFADQGWPEALSLVWRLDEVYR
jgi:hypothetical protein